MLYTLVQLTCKANISTVFIKLNKWFTPNSNQILLFVWESVKRKSSKRNATKQKMETIC